MANVTNSEMNRWPLQELPRFHFDRFWPTFDDNHNVVAKGIWGAQFEMPVAYRAAHPRQFYPGPKPVPQCRASQSAASPSYPSKSCDIKGNRNRKGEWIYHLPCMPYYEAARSEDFFCSEAQAIAAGYRRAIVGQ